MSKDLDFRYPALSDLRRKAKARMPYFAFEYLDSATGRELGAQTNARALDAVQFLPSILKGQIQPDLRCNVMGRQYQYPFGIAPVGMSGMLWPGGEAILARCARTHNIPYCLSTVTVATPEDIGPIACDNGWFQLYPPHKKDVMHDMLRRVKEQGFDKLVVTLDVPGESRRERQRRARLTTPLRLNVKMIWSILTHPAWSLGMAWHGKPNMPFVESYLSEEERSSDAFMHAGRVIRGYPDWAYMQALRDAWDGDLIAKGVMDAQDAKRLAAMGVDGIWVSNHSARQFEGGPASITQLPKIREALGPDIPIFFDSGVTSGLDIMRALALGANFVFLGRSFHYALCALGEQGVEHFIHILRADMTANMLQIGTPTLADLKSRLHNWSD
ncbi:MAG: alpha-hydroxy acid oxidase [Pseudomonadota bacterium]